MVVVVCHPAPEDVFFPGARRAFDCSLATKPHALARFACLHAAPCFASQESEKVAKAVFVLEDKDDDADAEVLTLSAVASKQKRSFLCSASFLKRSGSRQLGPRLR